MTDTPSVGLLRLELGQLVGKPIDYAWAKDLSWDSACFALTLVYRDYLRDLWASPNIALKGLSLESLLGTDPGLYDFMEEKTTPEDVAEYLERHSVTDDGCDRFGRREFEYAWYLLLKAFPDVLTQAASPVRPRWGTGDFSYEPINDFQRAVYLLFRESWRAKTCPLCGRHFIAQKPPQLYCSTKCFGETKRNRDLNWWRRVGSGNRKARAAKTRKKGGR